MSTIYGIFYRDGSPVGREEAEGMHRTFSWWEPDEARYLLRENLFLGQATLRITPESRYEHLPLERDGYLIAADARIDNREALAPLLDLPRRPLAEIGDSEFILAAYRKWGRECADRLLGDFAFVIWDPQKRELFCARDYIGVRPFYYYLDEKVFIFGSELKSLIRHPRVPTEIREASVANYAVNLHFTDTRHTFFRRVYKLEGGCTLTLSADKTESHRYWHPRNIRRKRSGDFEFYKERLRSLLEEAVKARLRTEAPVASHLSGGLDSSPITVLAAREMKRRDPAYRMPVYAWISAPTPEDDPFHNEWYYPRLVAEREGLDLHFTEIDFPEILRWLEESDIPSETGYALYYESKIRRDLKRRGVRVMISGWGGDEFISNHGYAVRCELFYRGKWGALIRKTRERLRHLAPESPGKTLLKILYHHLFVPSMPRAAYCHLPRIRCHDPDTTPFHPRFAALVEKESARRQHVFCRYYSCFLSDDMLRVWKNGHIQSRLNYWSQEAIPAGIEYHYPLLDRRLVELALEIPAEHYLGGGEDRFLYRRAIGDLLPPEILFGIHKEEKKRGEVAEKLLKRLISEIEGDRTVIGEVMGKYIRRPFTGEKEEERRRYLTILSSHLQRYI